MLNVLWLIFGSQYIIFDTNKFFINRFCIFGDKHGLIVGVYALVFIFGFFILFKSEYLHNYI